MDQNNTSTMEMRFLIPGKKLPRVMKVEGCKRLLDGFTAVFEKYPDAEILSFDGHAYKNKA